MSVLASSVLVSSILASDEFGQVQQVNVTDDLASLVIEHQSCQAKVSLYGGQVLSWQPAGQRDVFWLSEMANFEQGKAIRGGIPLCWPWFGAHPDDSENKVGNHGFARTALWQVSDIRLDKSGIEITLTFQGENKHDLWPNACKLTQVLSFGCQFTQTLTMSNLSDEDAFYSGALHSYFCVSAPENITIDTLNDVPFDDKLTAMSCPAQLLVNGAGPVDRVYHSNKVMQITDHKWQRTIEVSASNTKQWVFWNPGVEIANSMADIHAHGEQEFVCLEAANTQRQLLASGKTLTISQAIRVIPNV